MKTLLIAAAMAFAAPALAQTAAPAADPHAGHDGCCEKTADGKMACCEEMKAAGKEMACCKDKAAADAPAADPHAGHDMSPE